MVVSKTIGNYIVPMYIMFQSFELSHTTNISVSSRKNIMLSLMIGNLNSPEVRLVKSDMESYGKVYVWTTEKMQSLPSVVKSFWKCQKYVPTVTKKLFLGHSA